MGSSKLFWIITFLLITVVTGLIFRMQMAGVSLNFLKDLDLRRAHSHLGYYGVLFPIAWLALSGAKWSVPLNRSFIFYSFIVVLSYIGFLYEGYGLLAIVTSTVVLAIWIIFVWQNRIFINFTKGNWLHSIPISILLSACLIPIVAITSGNGSGIARNIAETFLAILMFGVFVPSILHRGITSPPSSWKWTLACVIASIDISNLYETWVFGIGTVFLGYLLLQALVIEFFSKNIPVRLLLYWVGFSLSVILIGLRIIPQTHMTAIAGIHFLILGPILLSFFKLHLNKKPPMIIEVGYELSLLIMVAAIALPTWIPELYMTFQKIAGYSGASIIIFLMCFFMCPKRLLGEKFE